MRVGEPGVPWQDGTEGEEDANVEQVVDALGEVGVQFFVAECAVATEDGAGKEACQEFVGAEEGDLWMGQFVKGKERKWAYGADNKHGQADGVHERTLLIDQLPLLSILETLAKHPPGRTPDDDRKRQLE